MCHVGYGATSGLGGTVLDYIDFEDPLILLVISIGRSVGSCGPFGFVDMFGHPATWPRHLYKLTLLVNCMSHLKVVSISCGSIMFNPDLSSISKCGPHPHLSSCLPMSPHVSHCFPLFPHFCVVNIHFSMVKPPPWSWGGPPGTFASGPCWWGPWPAWARPASGALSSSWKARGGSEQILSLWWLKMINPLRWNIQ